MSEKQWYIMHHMPMVGVQRKRSATEVVERFNMTQHRNLEVFAPMMTRVVKQGERFVTRDMPLAYQYVFIRGSFEEIRELCKLSDRFAFLVNRGSEERYATMTDRQMDTFQQVALGYTNNLPFLSLEDIDLEEGDLVEIIEGSFVGLVGYFMPKAKSGVGNIVLAVTQNMGTVIYDVKARYVKILEFSKKSRRSYDQIDAFVPKLFRALRSFYLREPLATREKSQLSVFCSRMGSVKVENPKTDAKLQALLSVAQLILGNGKQAAAARARLEQRMPKVTSVSTQSLVLLLAAVMGRNKELLDRGYELLTSDTQERISKSRMQLLEEYEFYRENM